MSAKPSSNARFSRKSLNIIILVTSVMIVTLLNLPGSETGKEQAEDQPTPISATDSEALFSEDEQAASSQQQKLVSLDIIKNKPIQSHQIQIESWNTDKGAKVLFVESHEVPMLDIRLVFNAGSARDGDLPGLALFTNAMLNEGTENYSVDDIAKHFEGLGAEFSNGAYRDQAIASLRTLTAPQFREPALAMFADIVAQPSFPKESLERIRNQLLIGLEHQQQRPGKVASNTFYETLYQSHPYGIPSDGTDSSLKKITAADLQQFHKRYYVAGNTVIAIVGDIDKQQAMAISQQLDQALQQGSPAGRLPTPQKPTEGIEKLVDFPSSQSHVLHGSVSIKRNDPIRYALVVGNQILGGGGFSSRLNQIIRQDNGLAYSVYSYFAPMAVDGPFVMGLQTRNDQRKQALQLMGDTLQSFIDQGPSQQELDDAKRHIIDSFPLSVANNSSIVGNLGAIGFYDLPLDYLDTYLSKIEAVTVQDVQAAFKKVIQPEAMLTVIVGPKQVDDGKE